MSKESVRNLVRSLDEFDLIWFFRDDIPSAFKGTALQVEDGLKNRLLTSMRVLSWRRRERLLADRFTMLTVRSEADSDYLRKVGLKAPIHVVPNGFERPATDPIRTPVTPPRLGFIGHFSHCPNCEGIH